MNLRSLFDAAPGSLARLTQSLEQSKLPEGVPAEAVGIALGALTGVLLFVAVVFAVARRAPRRPTPPAAPSADQVVLIPRYAMREIRELRESTRVMSVVPSTALSARAFAKMGYAFGERVGADPRAEEPSVEVDVEVEVEIGSESELGGRPPAVSVARVVVIDEPHPLAIIPPSSAAMRAAVALPELDFDDDATEIGVPTFDDPPKPGPAARRPKIRPVAPTPPRFAVAS